MNIDTTSGLARTLSLGILGCGIAQFILFFFSWFTDDYYSGWNVLTKSGGLPQFLALFVLFIAIGSVVLFGYLNLKRATIKKSFVFMALGGFGVELILLIIELIRGSSWNSAYGLSGNGQSLWFYLIILLSVTAIGASILLLRSIRSTSA